jgi:predicted RNA-binding Zn-ribbon protein involved in translation (DUF1610 family)
MISRAPRIERRESVSAEAVRCPHCGTLWRSEASQDLIVQDHRCPACQAPLAVTRQALHPLRVGIEGAVDVLDEVPARLEEAGFPDEAALLGRVFEAQRAQVTRTSGRLADQRRALRWTLRHIARRNSLTPGQRELLVELHDELHNAEELLGRGV